MNNDENEMNRNIVKTYITQYRRYGQTYIKVKDRDIREITLKNGKDAIFTFSRARSPFRVSKTKWLCWLRYKDTNKVVLSRHI